MDISLVYIVTDILTLTYQVMASNNIDNTSNNSNDIDNTSNNNNDIDNIKNSDNNNKSYFCISKIPTNLLKLILNLGYYFSIQNIYGIMLKVASAKSSKTL